MADKKKSTFMKDFKAFITKGNIIDMAVGVVIGGSFGKIVTGLVNYIINPFVGMFIQAGSLDSIKTVIKEAELDATGAVVAEEIAILWGTWAQTVIDFLITAFCIFVVLRIIMNVKNRFESEKIAKAEAEAAEAKLKADEEAAALKARQDALEESTLKQAELLAEIRDLLKKQ
ncbi:MAG: large conductance mechanosensitive channel protein MscL [Ruminococcaceae bacterium]|nr:large conductance mechanosensitive channel protein MscL [Oscillospiraceae bacterium]